MRSFHITFVHHIKPMVLHNFDADMGEWDDIELTLSYDVARKMLFFMTQDDYRVLMSMKEDDIYVRDAIGLPGGLTRENHNLLTVSDPAERYALSSLI